MQVVLGKKDSNVTAIDNIDILNYAKYVLREGKDTEKRELMSCFKSKINLARKIIELGTGAAENL